MTREQLIEAAQAAGGGERCVAIRACDLLEFLGVPTEGANDGVSGSSGETADNQPDSGNAAASEAADDD